MSTWAAIVDSDIDYSYVAPTTGQDAATIGKLVPWARHVTGEAIEYSVTGMRRAFRVRMQCAPGVYATGDASVGYSLTIQNQPVPNPEKSPGWEKLEALIAKVDLAWQTPDGDEIDHAMLKHKWKNELSAGFYNSLRWPTDETLAKRRGISTYDAAQLLSRARDHHELLQMYHKSLREFLKRAPPKLDTPMLVGNELHLHQDDRLPTLLYKEWKAAKNADFEGRPERDSIPVRVCPYKVDHAVAWARKLPRGEGAIFWVDNLEMGVWLREAFNAAGAQAYLCGASKADHQFLVDLEGKQDGSKLLILSLGANKEGKNLQFMQHQMYVQWPRPAKFAEQSLGRQHRHGQKADELVATTMLSLPFDRELFAACLNDALYIHQTLGTPQKLVYANYDPLPKIYTPAFLEERGFQPDKLDPATIRLRLAKFGQAEA